MIDTLRAAALLDLMTSIATLMLCGLAYCLVGLLLLMWLDCIPRYASVANTIEGGRRAWLAFLLWPLTCLWLLWHGRDG